MDNRTEAAKLAYDYMNRVINKYGKKIEGQAIYSAALISACHDLLKAQDALDRARRVRGLPRPGDSSRGSSGEAQYDSQGIGPEGQLSRHTVDPVRERTFALELEGEIQCPNCEIIMMNLSSFGDPYRTCTSCGYVEDR